MRSAAVCLNGVYHLASLRQRGADIPKLTADELYERGRNLFRTLQYDKAVGTSAPLLTLTLPIPRRPTCCSGAA